MKVGLIWVFPDCCSTAGEMDVNADPNDLQIEWDNSSLVIYSRPTAWCSRVIIILQLSRYNVVLHSTELLSISLKLECSTWPTRRLMRGRCRPARALTYVLLASCMYTITPQAPVAEIDAFLHTTGPEQPINLVP